MCLRHPLPSITFVLIALTSAVQIGASPQSSSSSSSSARSKAHVSQKAEPSLDPGSVNSGVYRSSWFGFTCKIPAAWVLRTEEMNAQADESRSDAQGAQPKAGDVGTEQESNRVLLDRRAEGGCPHIGSCGQVLLAAFSRPPEARAEDVNASILIAAESVSAYPGLKEAAQYFGPMTEVAKAQGFEVDEEPYQFASGTKTLVRGDFRKDVGTRVMRQSTLVMLAHGYALSFTFIAGTEDELEELVQGLRVAPVARTGR